MHVNNNLLNLKEITNPNFVIDNNFPITGDYKFEDDFWDFNDKNNTRLNSVQKSSLIFNWLKWEEKTNESIKNDMKIIAFFYLKCPSLISKKNATTRGYKPNYVKSLIDITFNVIERIIKNATIEVEEKKISLITDLSDISLEQLQSIPLTPQNGKLFKLLLGAIANPIIKKNLSCDIAWNQLDVKNMKIIQKEGSDLKDISTKPISDNFFADLVQQATKDIISFKNSMEVPLHSQIPKNYFFELKEELKKMNMVKAFELYVEIREKLRIKYFISGKRGANLETLRGRLVKEHQIPFKEFVKILRRIHGAAIYLLIQFTGVRFSEATSFQKGCVEISGGDMYIIKGTVIKNRSSNLPTDIDEWVATPIVRDAVDVLELFQRITFNDFLVSNFNSVYLEEENVPFSSQGLSSVLNSYVKGLGETNPKFKKYSDKHNHITVHRLRHTLALHLVRAKLGIPYISYHLKHLHTAIVAYRGVSNVTLGYGGFADEFFNSVPAINKARNEFFDQIYNPNLPVGGGVNTKEYIERRKEYFQGRIVSDDEIQDVIDELKEQSIPFVDVGLGYCGGRKDVRLNDGTKIPPPCIGQLQCNPLECGNAIITKSKLPIWEKMYDENQKKLLDPEYFYARDHFEKIVNQTLGVIKHFKNEG